MIHAMLNSELCQRLNEKHKDDDSLRIRMISVCLFPHAYACYRIHIDTVNYPTKFVSALQVVLRHKYCAGATLMLMKSIEAHLCDENVRDRRSGSIECVKYENSMRQKTELIKSAHTHSTSPMHMFTNTFRMENCRLTCLHGEFLLRVFGRFALKVLF